MASASVSSFADEKTGKGPEFWANEVIKGGYILHFRHGHRNRYTSSSRTPETDVTAFDAVAMRLDLRGENHPFGMVTCLTDEGVVEAQLIGAAFKILGVKVSEVLSSPSCRARQTAYHAFGTEGQIVNSLLHRTSIPVRQHKAVTLNLKQKILATKPVAGQNIAMTGHVGTLNVHEELMFEANEVGNMSDRDDSGFVVIERTARNTLIARYMFKRFRDFSVEVLDVPLN